MADDATRPRAPHPRGGHEGGLYRLLVETDDPVAEVSDFAAFREAGMQVDLCCGSDRRGAACPLASGNECTLANDADAVLVELDANGVAPHRHLHALALFHPTVPLVVSAPRDVAPAGGALPDRAIVLPMPASVNEQVRVVRRAVIEGRRRRLDQG